MAPLRGTWVTTPSDSVLDRAFKLTTCVSIGHYSRDLGLLKLPDMIAHLTSRPAKRLGVYPHRGLLAEGSAADLVLFDPETVKDMATFEEPKVPSRGIRFVLVNGEVAVDEGKMTGARGGKVLRRKEGKVVG